FEVADVLRQFGDAYREQHPLSYQQRKVFNAIIRCRTAALGGHVDECLECGRLRISYNPCNDRHCPKCGAFEKAQWLENRKAETLPITYHHVIFTTDHAINALARVNKRAVYHLLFQAATETLKAYGQKYLGGEIGITAVLHTWGEDLREHIHLHCIVTGGALVQDEAGERWESTPKGWLFPVVALSADYRDLSACDAQAGRFCAGLAKLYRQGKLKLVGACADLDVAALVEEMQAKAWEVFTRPAFEGVEGVYDYPSTGSGQAWGATSSALPSPTTASSTSGTVG
ncbi:MAG: transposase zinc-binding domain-containing protein, partial [Anaerolineae bacterium]